MDDEEVTASGEEEGGASGKGVEVFGEEDEGGRGLRREGFLKADALRDVVVAFARVDDISDKPRLETP